jgi:hypothetical protein
MITNNTQPVLLKNVNSTDMIEIKILINIYINCVGKHESNYK